MTEFTPLRTDDSIDPDQTDFTPELEPQATWCPGCGDFAVLKSLKTAMANLGRDPDEILLVTGIGCSGKLSSYFESYGFHSIHGRAVPVARAAKIANPDLEVIVAGGDGDGYGIGGNHFLHSARENHDITYIVFNNEIFGLTKGQTSPTSPKGHTSKTQPKGAAKDPIRPLSLGLDAGASYVARTAAVNPRQAANVVQEAVEHDGFSHIDFLTQCPTWNKDAREYIPYTDIQDDDEFSVDITDARDAADMMDEAERKIHDGEVLTGRFYEEENRRTYHEEKRHRNAVTDRPTVYQNFDDDYEWESAESLIDKHL